MLKHNNIYLKKYVFSLQYEANRLRLNLNHVPGSPHPAPNLNNIFHQTPVPDLFLMLSNNQGELNENNIKRITKRQ